MSTVMTNRRLILRRARTTDPISSKEGALEVEKRSHSQRVRLLSQYKDGARLDDEAAIGAGLLHTCFWKRCSELRTQGLIEPVKIGDMILTRNGRLGKPRQVCKITDMGLRELRNRGIL